MHWFTKHSSCQHTSYVTKLPVLKDNKLFASRYLVESSYGLLAKVANDVRMSFEHADMIAHLFGDSEELVRGGYVGGDLYSSIGGQQPLS